jgi:hypothetical protein
MKETGTPQRDGLDDMTVAWGLTGGRKGRYNNIKHQVSNIKDTDMKY